jgi:hypothetical protein
MIKYSPENENCAVERIDFCRDDVMITLENRFDTYAVFVEDEDDDFDMADYDPDQGAMMTFADEEAGECTESYVEGGLTDQENQAIIKAFAARMEGGVADLGWTWLDRELWFYGPIKRESQE